MVEQVMHKHSFDYEGATTAIYHANKGQGLPQHSHSYRHVTYCASGRCMIRTEHAGEFEITPENQPIEFSEGKWHEIEALEDNTVFVNVFGIGKY